MSPGTPKSASSSRPSTVVFVHGWSVTSTDTYGKLPECLVNVARQHGLTLDARHVFLGKYVSFRDEVTVDDIARGFEQAIRTELKDLLAKGDRFACVTHSTGGPVVRQWWHRFYMKPSGAPACPMSHLVMLAPANFGSALAQLGKGTLSRLKTWFDGVEPGTGVLDWLELGSPESWDLNRAWIREKKDFAAVNGTFPFVLTGQSIDRKLYDHLNSYTGEPGSDGVVRAAAANLNAGYARLVQKGDEKGRQILAIDSAETSPVTAFKLVAGRSHSGEKMGILRSVGAQDSDHPTVKALMRCLDVTSAQAYRDLAAAFETENAQLQDAERVDSVIRRGLPDSHYLIDRFSMVIFRVRDDEGNAIGEFDLTLTAVPNNAPATAKASADLLPKGFLQDRQRNKRSRGTLTFFLNQDVMSGCAAVPKPGSSGEALREAIAGVRQMGIVLEPHLTSGFVHFQKAALAAESSVVDRVLRANQTMLVDIVMRRVVRGGVMRLQRLDRRDDRSFDREPEGPPIDEP